MTEIERDELKRLDALQRAGHTWLSGADLARLADLRRAEILDTVATMLPPVMPAIPNMETR